MKIRSIACAFLLILTAVMPASAFAEGASVQTRQKWMQEIRNYKYEFFTKKLKLTEQQQEAFFPAYEAMEKAIFTINKEARDLSNRIAKEASATDTEYEAAATAMARVKQREGNIEMEYFNRFEKILTKKQLFLLKRAEDEFTQNMLTHHRRASK